MDLYLTTSSTTFQSACAHDTNLFITESYLSSLVGDLYHGVTYIHTPTCPSSSRRYHSLGTDLSTRIHKVRIYPLRKETDMRTRDRSKDRCNYRGLNTVPILNNWEKIFRQNVNEQMTQEHTEKCKKNSLICPPFCEDKFLTEKR